MIEENNIIVIKRDDRETSFDSDKVFQAILNAFLALKIKNGEESTLDVTLLNNVNALTSQVEDLILEKEYIRLTVEEIQDNIIDVLLDSTFNDVAREYIEYAERKRQERLQLSDLAWNVQKLYDNDPSVVHENANKDSRKFVTKRDMTAGQVSKGDGLKLLPKKVANAHIRGEIYWHDLDFSPRMSYSNCCLVNAEDMLTNGFTMGSADLKTPSNLNVASQHLVQIIAGVSSSQYGGTSVPEIDILLAPYAEKDFNYFKQKASRLTKDVKKQEEVALEDTLESIYKAMKSLEYGINSLNANAGQVPFVTLSFGRGTTLFEKEIQKAILRVRIKGIGAEGKTAIFPKLTMFLEDGVNLSPTDPNYDVKQLALECASKRMYPDILNVERLREITGTVPTPMGKRVV